MKKHLILIILVSTCMAGKPWPTAAFINTQDQVTLEGRHLALSDVLYTLAHLKHLNLTLAPNIEGQLNLHWHNLPWPQTIATLKQQHNLTITATKNHWYIRQQKPLYQWYKININHDTLLTLKAQGHTLTQHLSKEALLNLDPKQSTVFLWGTKEDQEHIHQWQTPSNALINLQLYCLLIDHQGLHDLGLSPTLQQSIAPEDWHHLLHKTGWLDMLSHLKAWGIGRLLGHWLNESQQEGHTLILAQPQITTLSGHTASIKAGLKFPIQQKNNRGSNTTTYQEASMQLTATPFSNPDHSIDITLDLTYDWPEIETSTTPYIQTRSLHTRIIAPAGHTWVLGSIHEQQHNHQTQQTGRMPWLKAWLTNKTSTTRTHSLLILMIPRIQPLKKPAQGGLF